MSHVIETVGLGKRYTLKQGAWKYSTLGESLARPLTAMRRRTRNSSSRTRGDELWALRDIDLTVEEGEAVGIVGRNGAGKSTLLKILTGITEPTVGAARTRGRIGALLEVGTGFHPELTGRENIYLNAALLGMSRRDTNRRFEQIIDFAGVHRFLDTPLKRYSSGMALRLAFGVAAHLEPDILIVDEVLAVGDSEFQRKCLGKMSELTGQGRTAMFVSHDLGAVTRLCPRAIWLVGGEVRADSNSAEVIESYLRAGLASSLPEAEFESSGSDPVELLYVAVTDSSGLPVSEPRRDAQLSIRVQFSVHQRTPALDLSVCVANQRGATILHETWSDTRSPERSADDPGEYHATVTIPPVLPAGRYVVSVWIGFPVAPSEFETLVDKEVLEFEVWPRRDDLHHSIARDRLAQPLVEWHVVGRPSVEPTRRL